MKRLSLRWMRILVALVTLFSIASVFLDFYGPFAGFLNRPALYLQVVPSAVKFVGDAGVAAAGFLVVLLLTLICGRLYCSFFCPLGIVFDIVPRLVRKRRKDAYAHPHNRLRGFVLVAAILSLCMGSFLILNLFDPFSNFGRGMTCLVKPLAVLINNGVSHILETFDIFLVGPVQFKGLNYPVFCLILLFYLMTLFLAVREGRIYCNTLCPVGTVLGILARVAPIKIRIDSDTCTRCRRCEIRCKARCIDMKNGFVDASRCVSCFNCLDACRSQSIYWGRDLKPDADVPVSRDRRKMLAWLVFLLPLLYRRLHAQLPPPPVKDLSLTPVIKTTPVTPPGSRGISHFTSSCTACLLCVSACPSQVIQPGLISYGSKGFMMPSLTPATGYCSYTCNRCGQVCPTGAINSLSLEEKQLTRIGKAIFVRPNCIVITNKTECGACSEHCPTKAVTMVVEEGLRVPVVNVSICIGCGACEHACPSKPFKAIYVDGNREHERAQRPAFKKVTVPVEEEDFPF